jgi:predicted nucleic acid-binding protein
MAGNSIATRFMSVRSFFDNVPVHIDDDGVPAKQQRARNSVIEHRREHTGVVPVQVLQEYFVTVTTKLKLEVGRARGKVDCLPNST